MTSTELVRALRRRAVDGDARDIDPGDDVRLDAVAADLLDRFRARGDRDAFALLFELAHPRLRAMAAGLLRRLPAPVEPDDLVSRFVTRVFTDVRLPAGRVDRFLAFAYVSLRHDLVDQWRRHKRAETHHRALVDGRPDAVEPAPVDPARLHARAAGFFDLVAETFAALEPRDRRVLAARDLLDLSYARVAGALDLPPGQVGMVIRRARGRLLERVLSALASGDGPDPELRDAVRQRLVDERSVGRVVRRALEDATAAGRARLADLVYELAKALFTREPDVGARTLVHAAPRAPAAIAAEARVLLRRVDGDADAALDDVDRCLALLERLEGRSGRQQVLLALHLVHAGRPEEAEAVLRALDVEDRDAHTRMRARVNLALALLRQERFAEARAVAADAAERWPDNPVPWINLTYATARVEDKQGFAAARAGLRAAQRRAPSPWAAAWIEESLGTLAEDAGVPPDVEDSP